MSFDCFDLFLVFHLLVCRNSLFIMDAIMYIYICIHIDYGLWIYLFNIDFTCVASMFLPAFHALKHWGIFSMCLPTCASLKVMLLIDIELAYMNTNHEDFIGFAK